MHAAALRYLSAVARLGSIRRASEELHVASSAISRQIQKIEDEFGMPLFERLHNGLHLNAAGRTVLDHAERTLHEFELVCAELGEMRGSRTGTVRIASLDSLLVSFLPDQVDRYTRAHPNVEFQIRSTSHATIATMVAEGEADIGITFDLPIPQMVEFVADVPMPLMAMVARDHPLAGRRSVSLGDCAKYRLLLQLDTSAIQSLIDMELSALRRNGHVLVTSNNLMMLKQFVRRGMGVAFYTPIGMAEEIAEGSIVGVPLAGTRLGGMRLGLVVPRHRRLTPAVNEMIENLSQGLGQLPRAGPAA